MSEGIRAPIQTITRFIGTSTALMTCLLVTHLASADNATDFQSLATGSHVRIAALGLASDWIVGDIIEADEKSVTVRLMGRHETVLVPREKMTTVDVGEGLRSRWVNFGIGAGVGVVTGAAACGEISTKSNTRYVSTTAVAAVCAALGSAVGGLIGAAIPPSEQWHRLVPSRYRFTLIPRLDHELGFAVVAGF